MDSFTFFFFKIVLRLPQFFITLFLSLISRLLHKIPLHLLLWLTPNYFQFSSVQSSRSVVSDSLRPHESQHTRPPCPSPTPRVHSNSCPSSWWCHQPSHPLSSPSPSTITLRSLLSHSQQAFPDLPLSKLFLPFSAYVIPYPIIAHCITRTSFNYFIFRVLTPRGQVYLSPLLLHFPLLTECLSHRKSPLIISAKWMSDLFKATFWTAWNSD